MGSINRRLLTIGLSGLLVLAAPGAVTAQEYPPSDGGGEETGEPATAEPEPEAAEEAPVEGEERGSSETTGGAAAGDAGALGALARTGAGIALLTLIGLASLTLGAVFVRRARTA